MPCITLKAWFPYTCFQRWVHPFLKGLYPLLNQIVEAYIESGVIRYGTQPMKRITQHIQGTPF